MLKLKKALAVVLIAVAAFAFVVGPLAINWCNATHSPVIAGPQYPPDIPPPEDDEDSGGGSANSIGQI